MAKLDPPQTTPAQLSDYTLKVSARPLEGKNVIVTGAGTGIGQGVLLACSLAGANVAAHYYNEQTEMERTIETIRSFGGTARSFQADFRDLSRAESFAHEVLDHFGGRTHVLVNNAGITFDQDLSRYTISQFQTLVNVNLGATFFLSEIIGEQMKAQHKGTIGGAHIFNFSSLHADRVINGHELYGATKAAIRTFTRNSGVVLGPEVVVIGVTPGWCVVPHHYEIDPDLTLEKAAASAPLGKVMTPADMGRLIVHLTHPDFIYLHTQTVTFDGGAGAPFGGYDFHTPPRCKFGRGYVEE